MKQLIHKVLIALLFGLGATGITGLALGYHIFKTGGIEFFICLILLIQAYQFHIMQDSSG